MKLSLYERGLAAILLTLALPAILIAALAIVLSTGNNPFFAQRRVGRGNVTFTVYKLRTMGTHAPVGPTHEVGKSYVTPIGRFLRLSHLDELPQLWNVVRGEMKFVGPRPCLETQNELISARRRRRVEELFPGITGLSQVLGVDMSHPQKLARLDAKYRSRACALFDIKIVAMTLVPLRSCRGYSK